MKSPRSKSLLKCPKCKGSGVIPNPYVFGLKARQLRKGMQISLREISRRMGISATHLSDLERGKRQWNSRLEALFMECLD